MASSNQPNPADQSTLTTITTDASNNSTLVPADSPPLLPPPPPSHGHSATTTTSRPPDLTITDLHTTATSSVGDPTTEPVIGPHEVHLGAHSSSSSEGSDSSDSSSSSDTETPPPELSHSSVQPVRMHTRARTSRAIPSKSTVSAAQKVHFSHSIEQRERARRGGSSLTTCTGSGAGLSGIEVGDISSVQLKLGLDAQLARSRASVLATLYQNYMSELNTAQPVTKETPKLAGKSKKARAATKPKLKSYPRPLSKVHTYIVVFHAPPTLPCLSL